MDAKVMELRLEKWLPIFEAQAKSGMSKTEWCREKGIKKWEFYERQRECRAYLLEKTEKNTPTPFNPTESPAFVEFPLDAYYNTEPKQQPSEKEHGSISVTCGKFTISLNGKVDGDTLSTVIREVSRVK